MSTVNPPATFAQLGDVSYAYTFAAGRIRLTLQDRLDLLGAGLVPLYGDLAGTGSDTIRVTRLGGVGFAEAMTAMASETDTIVPTGFTTGYDTMTIARHGLAKSESYQAAVLNREQGVSLDALMALIPNSWTATLRSKVCTSGAAISSTVGSASTYWSFDDELDLIASFTNTTGFEGMASAIRDPHVYNQLRDSMRSEPSYQFPEPANQQNGLRPGGGFYVNNFLGLNNYSTADVNQSGGGYQNFAFVPGAIGWVRASTMPIVVEDPETAMYLPEFGLIVERKSRGDSGQGRFDANAFIGVGRADPTLFPQFRAIAKV